VRRNLLFMMYPMKGRCWPWHLEQLALHKDAFNGKRLVVVMTDDKTDPADAVRERGAPLDATFVESPNDPAMPIRLDFHKYLAEFESTSADEGVFFAHTKGITHIYAVGAVLAWAECMFRLNLGSPALIDKLFETHEAIGAFQKVGFHGGSNWHYSGGFFWLRHDALFSRDWRNSYVGDRYGIEGFPGGIVPDLEKAFCLTPDADHGNLYNRVLPEGQSAVWLEGLKKKFGI
jgi:hypothetical protein